MPREQAKKPAKQEKSPALLQPRRGEQSDEWGGFVQINLTPLDKALFDKWAETNTPHVQAYIDEHLGEGLKLSVTFDGEHNSYIASYTGRPNTDESLPFRCTLSARSGEFLEALALLVYKHEQVCSGDWADYLINGTKLPNWG